MKKLGLCVLAMTVIALMFSGSALAQGDASYYFTTYYSNNVSGAPDNTVRFINDGDTGGTLWADIYVFDDSQELQACGSCLITPDGLLSEDVKTQLTNNTLTGKFPARGVIKVISDPTGSPYSPSWTSGLRGWATHIQSAANKGAGPYSTTEAPVADSNLTASEATLLGNLCYFTVVELGSGHGTITCTPEDSDF
jgi:hypothetical protein